MLSFNLIPSQFLLCRAIADMDPEERAQAARGLLAALGDARAFDLAQRNQVAPVVAHVLMDSASGGLPPQWRAVHDSTHARISAYLVELDRVAAQLVNGGVSVVILENGALARAVYPCPGCFNFGDLDLLICKGQLSIAQQILLDSGYGEAEASTRDTTDLPSGRVVYARVLANGLALRLNLQWSLVARRWFNVSEPGVAVLMERSIPITGSAARILSPEDNLFQLAVHNSSHAYVRKPGIRLHLDIDRFVRRVSVDWVKFLELVEQHQVKTAVYFSLAIPRALFQTPIPEEVLARLQPSAWKVWLIQRWLARVGLFDPDEPKFGRLGYIFFTALLYDDWRGLWRGIFPSRAWMRERYGFQNEWLLPYYHARRLMDLAFRRVVV